MHIHDQNQDPINQPFLWKFVHVEHILLHQFV